MVLPKKYEISQCSKIKWYKDVHLKFLSISKFRICYGSRYSQQLPITFANIRLVHFCNDQISTFLNFSYPDQCLLLDPCSMEEVCCLKKTEILLFGSEKTEKFLRFCFLCKKNSKAHFQSKHKFGHFILTRKKFSSIFHCYSTDLQQKLIAQNDVSGKLSILKEAEPGSSNVSGSDLKISLFIDYANTASYSRDLDSILEFNGSFTNPQVLSKSYTCPFMLLNTPCKRRQSLTKYRTKWFISKPSTMKEAISSPQQSQSPILSPSFLSSSSMEYNRKTISVHCTANFILNYLRKYSEFTVPTDSNNFKSSLWQYGCEYFNLLKLLFLLMILLAEGSNAILLSGAPGSYAR